MIDPKGCDLCGVKHAPHDGELELDLFAGEPWRGRSPRGLTRVRISLFLRREPPSHEVYLDPAQLDFWRRGSKATTKKNAPGKQPGAPSLLPLRNRSRRDRSRKFYQGE